MPGSREIGLLDVVTFDDRMKMDVPTVIPLRTLDFQESDSALLRLRPQSTTTQLNEACVQPIDVFLHCPMGMTERQGDEPEFFAGSMIAHAGSDMS